MNAGARAHANACGCFCMQAHKRLRKLFLISLFERKAMLLHSIDKAVGGRERKKNIRNERRCNFAGVKEIYFEHIGIKYALMRGLTENGM